MSKNIIQSLHDLINNTPENPTASVLDVMRTFGDWRQDDEVTWEFLRPAFERIVSGLGSEREISRHMYYTICVSILSIFRESPKLTVRNYTDLVDHVVASHTAGSSEGERENYLGPLLAYGALIESKFMTTPEEVNDVVSRMLAIIRSNTSLMSVCYTFITFQVEMGSLELFKTIEAALTQNLIENKNQLTMDHLYVLHVMNDVHKSEAAAQLLSSSRIIDKENFSQLVECILRSGNLDHPFLPICIRPITAREDLLSDFWDEVMNTLTPDSTTAQEGFILSLFCYVVRTLKRSSFAKITSLLKPVFFRLLSAKKPEHQRVTRKALRLLKRRLLLASNSEKMMALNRLFDGNYLRMDEK